MYGKTFINVLAALATAPLGRKAPCSAPFQKLSFKNSFSIYILKSIQ
jgi:hypothetical protein